ncbi:MAG: ABC transporter substrate-binding protein [Tumebacillaceae bacterium]
MSKKFIAATIVLTMAAAGLVGCGSKSTSGADSKVIKVGANFEMTGSVASFGNSQLQGIELAAKEINAAGGVLGKQLEIDKQDNASKADESTRIATKLITQDKVDVLMGATTSTNTLAAVQVADDKKIPMLSASATNPNVTFDSKKNQVNPYVFRACFIDPFQGKVMADFSAKNLHAKTAVIYKDVASDYSKGLAEYFQKTFEAEGGKVLTVESFQTNDTDFKAVLTRIKDKNPDVIYVPGYYQEVGKIVKQARDLGINKPMEGGDGWDAPQIVDIAGKAALNNTFISNHYSPQDPDPKVKKFVDAYKAAYGIEPDSMAVLGYDGMYLLADAIKRAGSVDHEKVKDALAATTDFEGVTGKLKFDDHHDPVKSAVVLEYKDGVQTFNSKVNP